jgi:hypothetical protein
MCFTHGTGDAGIGDGRFEPPHARLSGLNQNAYHGPRVTTIPSAPEPQEKEVNMTARNFSLTAAIIFAVIALVQLARTIFGWRVTIDTYAVPLWFSWVAFIVATGLSYFGWKAYSVGTRT